MKMQIIIGLDGSIKLTVANGEFEPAKAAIEQAINGLRMEGIDFSEVGEVERHRHDNQHEHTNTNVNV
ncbi:MAG: hypothetical protein HZB51_34310 [Chloroflexi bacterium]|nr:hypothetical protein [Chloroflexota bacterium]